jgi:hypothetical protein
MRGVRPEGGAGIWPSLRLWLTSASWWGETVLAHDLQQAMSGLRARGWRFRRASPRHHAVWDSERALQRRLRVVVLPDRSARLTLAELDALLRHRLQPLAPELQAADPALLHSAMLKAWIALAPAWLGPGKALDVTREAGPMRGRRHDF